MTMVETNSELTKLSQFAELVLRRAEETGAGESTVTIRSLNSPLRYEMQLLEAIEMARQNGVSVLYTRTVDGSTLVWHRFHCSGRPDFLAWLFYELESIANGERGEPSQIQSS